LEEFGVAVALHVISHNQQKAAVVNKLKIWTQTSIAKLQHQRQNIYLSASHNLLQLASNQQYLKYLSLMHILASLRM
jgi:hypothetical protein